MTDGPNRRLAITLPLNRTVGDRRDFECDRDELTETGAIELRAFLSVFTRAQENYWTQYELGVIDANRLLRYRTAFSTMLATERTRMGFPFPGTYEVRNQ